MNLFTRFAACSGDPQAPFMRDPEGRRCSYAEMHLRSARMAHALRLAGVQPGDRVAAQIDKSADGILLYLATLRVGGVFLPLNTAYTLAEMEYFLGDAEPRLLVCQPGNRDERKNCQGRSIAVHLIRVNVILDHRTSPLSRWWSWR